MAAAVTCESTYAQLGLPDAPLVLDIRAEAELGRTPRLIPGAGRRNPDHVTQWTRTLPRDRAISLYCRDGGAVSQSAADVLTAQGFPASVLTGGMQRWLESGYATTRLRAELNVPGGSRWVTRERPKIDRLACPWLVRRFIDPDALFFYVPAHRVRADASGLGAEPYDIPDVTFSHRGPRCSFDAFLDEFELHDPILDTLADIVRAADTDELAQSREAPGLLAISLDFSTA